MDSLDHVQAEALRTFKKGKSLAVLGGGECGKSFLLHHVLKAARQEIGPTPFVTACDPSNQASERILGRTLHSTFGAPPHWRWSKKGLWRILSGKQKRLDSLRKVNVLVVDEICLLTGDVLDAIDYVFRKLAVSEEASSIPFGGRQVVLSGDAFQLPEIPQTPHERSAEDEEDEFSGQDGPVHSSRAWFLTFGGFGCGTVVVLDTNHLQAGDPYFYDILQRIRIGKPLNEDILTINRTCAHPSSPPKTHTELRLTKFEVDKRNFGAISALPGPMRSSKARYSFFASKSDSIRNRLDQASPSTLHLKKGCAVLMLVAVAHLKPGTRVVVTDIVSSSGGPHPDCIVVSHGFERFSLSPYTFSIRASDTTVLAQRKQFPVIAAYAVTVHRCQGMTLSKVAMDFSRVSAWKPFGMVYVALSRYTSLAGLWVRYLSAEHIQVNPDSIYLMEKTNLLRSHHPERVISSVSPIPRPLIRELASLLHSRNRPVKRLKRVS